MEKITSIIANALEKIKEYYIEPDFEVELKAGLPNGKIACHYCSNVLFSLRRNLKPGFEKALEGALLADKMISKVEFVNGYVNLTMSPLFFANLLKEILAGDIFPNTGNGLKTNVEYCSINPTGFLHIGHARNAILGDAIARILKKANFDVTKEYYVNDAGNQINLLAQSIYARFAANNGIDYPFPEGGYVGDEMVEMAKNVKADDSIEQIGQMAVEHFLNTIKADLAQLKIQHDVFSSEKDIMNSGYIQKAIDLLKKKNYLYEGERDNKKAKKGVATNETLLLLKTTVFGDDEDRPLTKSDGSWTYLAPDIGYHLNKIERGFDYLICVLGADHDSYAQRIKIAVKALKEDIKHATPICQMVSFELEGKSVKFSKRLGTAIRTRDFLQEVDVDVFRFMILAKTAGTPFLFDYDSAVSLSMKNPVFYVQYAHARGCSAIRNAQITQDETDALHNNQNFQTEAFKIEAFQEMLVLASYFKQTLHDAAVQLSPHILANYAQKLAETLHKLWQVGKLDDSKRLIIPDNRNETIARLTIVKAFLFVLSECLDALGINAPESMQ